MVSAKSELSYSHLAEEIEAMKIEIADLKRKCKLLEDKIETATNKSKLPAKDSVIHVPSPGNQQRMTPPNIAVQANAPALRSSELFSSPPQMSVSLNPNRNVALNQSQFNQSQTRRSPLSSVGLQKIQQLTFNNIAGPVTPQPSTPQAQPLQAPVRQPPQAAFVPGTRPHTPFTPHSQQNEVQAHSPQVQQQPIQARANVKLAQPSVLNVEDSNEEFKPLMILPHEGGIKSVNQTDTNQSSTPVSSTSDQGSVQTDELERNTMAPARNELKKVLKLIEEFEALKAEREEEIPTLQKKSFVLEDKIASVSTKLELPVTDSVIRVPSPGNQQRMTSPNITVQTNAPGLRGSEQFSPPPQMSASLNPNRNMALNQSQFNQSQTRRSPLSSVGLQKIQQQPFNNIAGPVTPQPSTPQAQPQQAPVRQPPQAASDPGTQLTPFTPHSQQNEVQAHSPHVQQQPIQARANVKQSQPSVLNVDDINEEFKPLMTLPQEGGIKSANQTDTNQSSTPVSSTSDQGSVRTGDYNGERVSRRNS